MPDCAQGEAANWVTNTAGWARLCLRLSPNQFSTHGQAHGAKFSHRNSCNMSIHMSSLHRYWYQCSTHETRDVSGLRPEHVRLRSVGMISYVEISRRPLLEHLRPKPGLRVAPFQQSLD